jgi:hypothetical protein
MKEDILKYLGTVAQSTAKIIADRLGLPSLEVLRELNAMIKDGTVERGMRKGEYAYWLTRVEAKPAEKVASNVEARPKSLIEALVKAADAVPPKAELLSLLGASEGSRRILDAIACAQALIRDRNDQRELRKTTAETFDAYRQGATAEIESLKAANAKLKENAAALERSIDDLTGVADVQLPKVYVTVGKTAPPKRHADLLRAQRRAAALVRTERESEVLVLAPVGRMVRGSEWREQ